MTEDEAKATKTCQETLNMLPWFSPEGALIRDAGPWNCIGSQCMAWRWDKDAMELQLDAGGPLLRRVHGDAMHGYCGKAGKP